MSEEIDRTRERERERERERDLSSKVQQLGITLGLQRGEANFHSVLLAGRQGSKRIKNAKYATLIQSSTTWSNCVI